MDLFRTKAYVVERGEGTMLTTFLTSTWGLEVPVIGAPMSPTTEGVNEPLLTVRELLRLRVHGSLAERADVPISCNS